MCPCVCLAIDADDGLLLPNRRWDTVTTSDDWYQDLSTFYMSCTTSYK